ncbi:MAG: hypothetical protein EOP08_04435, partial [Proteobacteria bacterium]
MILCSGCEKDPPPPVRSVEDAPDAAGPIASGFGDAPPLPPSGSWKTEVESFTTEERCVQDLRVASPLLGEALLLLGYETLAQDACGMLAATKEHDTKRCGKILATSLRARCVMLVATTTAEPDACPYLEARDRSRGRDATCLALASGREALCAGEGSPADERACRAIFAEDGARCASLLPEPRARCVRDVERWRGLVPRRATGPAEEKTKGTLTLTPIGSAPADDAGAPVEPLHVELRDAARGVVLARGATETTLVFGDSRYSNPTSYVPPTIGSARVVRRSATDGRQRGCALGLLLGRTGGTPRNQTAPALDVAHA